MPQGGPTPARTDDGPVLHLDPIPPHARASAAGRRVDLAIVIDVLRTTTTVPILMDSGLRQVRLSPSLRVARACAAQEGDLLIGERRGVPPVGFNHGNSPAVLQHHDMDGRTATLVSENAPAVLPHLEHAGEVVLASFVNAGAVTRYAADARFQRIELVPCGFRGAADGDDLVVAGLLADRLLRLRPELVPTGATLAAIDQVRSHPDALSALFATRAARYLQRLGLERDVGLAADLDRSEVVPRLLAPVPCAGGVVYPFVPLVPAGRAADVPASSTSATP